MRIVHKLMLATLLPAILIWTVGIYATNVSEQSLRAAIEANSITRASSVMDELDRIIHVRTSSWKALVNNEQVQEALQASNEKFASNKDVEALIDRREKAWQEMAASETSPLLKSLLRNRVSSDLRRRIHQLTAGRRDIVFSEVILTNRFGANIAQTNRTSDYRQNDEAWWNNAVRDGVWISDINYDENAKGYSIEICLRVDDDEGNLAGVIKALLSIDGILNLIDSRAVGLDLGERLILLDHHGKVIHADHDTGTPLDQESPYIEKVELSDAVPQATVSWVEPITNQSYLLAFARSQGFGDFEGLGWVVVDQRRESTAFAPVIRMRQQVFFLALAATLLAVAVGGLLAWSLSHRLGRISDATIAIANGDLDRQVIDHGTDEINRLSVQFNRMTDRVKQANDELIAARDEANHANAAKSFFLATMSHEIRTPMNGIIGMSELLSMSPMDAKQQELLGVVRGEAHTLLSLINDILDFSKVEAGKMELESVNFDLSKLVHQAIQTLSLRAEQKGIKLETDIQAEVPRFVRGDPGRLRQIIVNLVSNALKFTEEGFVNISVQPNREAINLDDAGQPHGGNFRFSIADTGIGISPKSQADIFDLFSQAEASTTRKYGGTGLGLAISRQLVSMMGGRIWLESKVAEGTTFHFTVALDTDDVSDVDDLADSELDADSISNASDVLAINRGCKPLSILLVDDGDVNRRVAEGLLEQLGHQVDTAEDGKQAVDAVAQRDYDLVLMDWHMPVMDGREATRQIRNREATTGKHLPIIALTAAAMHGDRKKCLDAGMDDFLSKPIDLQRLAAAISRHSEANPAVSLNLNSIAEKPITASTEIDDTGQSDVSQTPIDETVKHAYEMIDVDQAKACLGVGNEEMLVELSQLMKVESVQRIDELRQGLADGDRELVARAAHTLKGAVASFGAEDIVKLSVELEKQAKDQELDQVANQVASLAGLVDKLVLELDRFALELQ